MRLQLNDRDGGPMAGVRKRHHITLNADGIRGLRDMRSRSVGMMQEMVDNAREAEAAGHGAMASRERVYLRRQRAIARALGRMITAGPGQHDARGLMALCRDDSYEREIGMVTTSETETE